MAPVCRGSEVRHAEEAWWPPGAQPDAEAAGSAESLFDFTGSITLHRSVLTKVLWSGRVDVPKRHSAVRAGTVEQSVRTWGKEVQGRDDEGARRLEHEPQQVTS